MIKLNNIVFKYDNTNVPILNNVSFELNKGEIMAVVGPSGGGKSTLLRIISGLEQPFSGSIEINQKMVFSDVTNIKPENRGIGMVFQDYALFPHMTVEKNIAYGVDHIPKKERKLRIETMLELVNLKGYEKRYPHQLSGGQQQRIALARALAPKPKILLLDEPFSNLDTEMLEKVRNELFEIINFTQITTIMVTHNPEDAKTADKILRLASGKMSIV